MRVKNFKRYWMVQMWTMWNNGHKCRVLELRRSWSFGIPSVITYFRLSDTFGYWILSVIGYFQLSNTLIEMRSSNNSRATFLDLNTCTNFRIRYRVSEVNLGLPQLVNKMAIFVTFVDSWMPQTNATGSFILDVAMVLDTSLWSNYQN